MTNMPSTITDLFVNEVTAGVPNVGSAYLDGTGVSNYSLYGWDWTSCNATFNGTNYDRLFVWPNRTSGIFFYDPASGSTVGAGITVSSPNVIFSPWFDDIHGLLYFVVYNTSTGTSTLYTCNPSPNGATNINVYVNGCCQFTPFAYGGTVGVQSSGFAWFVIAGNDSSGHRALFAFNGVGGALYQLTSNSTLSGYPDFFSPSTVPSKQVGATAPGVGSWQVMCVCGTGGLDFTNPATWPNYSNDIARLSISFQNGVPTNFGCNRLNVRFANTIVQNPSYWSSYPGSNATSLTSTNTVLINGQLISCTSGCTWDYGNPATAGSNPVYQGRWGMSFDGSMNNGVWGAALQSYFLCFTDSVNTTIF